MAIMSSAMKMSMLFIRAIQSLFQIQIRNQSIYVNWLYVVSSGYLGGFDLFRSH